MFMASPRTLAAGAGLGTPARLAGRIGLSWNPCLPVAWPEVNLIYRFRQTRYHITIVQPTSDVGVDTVPAPPLGRSRPQIIMVDGIVIEGTAIRLIDDGIDHAVRINMV
jgi:cellobiose phosphorylase